MKLIDITYNDYRLLKKAVDSAEAWRGSKVGNPDPKPPQAFDKEIKAMREVLKKIREGRVVNNEPTKKTVELADLVGEYILSGVDRYAGEALCGTRKYAHADMIRFRLDGKVYVATEDPDDGYRSTLNEIFIAEEEIKNKFRGVRVVSTLQGEELSFVNKKTGKLILEIGTDRSDDYYPFFVARFNPENI